MFGAERKAIIGTRPRGQLGASMDGETGLTSRQEMPTRLPTQ
jgi:hypothetical protein